MADTQNDNQQQPQNEGSPIGPPRPITVAGNGRLRAVFDRGVRNKTIQQGPIAPATRVQPLATGVTSEAQPRPISLQGAGMGKLPRIKEEPKPTLRGQLDKGKPVQPIAVPEVSDIQALAPQRQLTETEIEADRTKYLPTAIANTLETARNSAQDKEYFDAFIAPNLQKTLQEDFNSGELSVSLNKDRYPVIVRKTDGIIENIFQGVKDRINAVKGLDEYDRLDDAGKIQFLSGKSTLRIPTLSQVGSPTKDIYSGQQTQEYQGVVPTERGEVGETAYGIGGVLPDIATGVITAPLNVVAPGYSLASVSAIQGRTGAINAAQQAFQVAKQNGLSDEESLQVAKNAEKRGGVTGALEGLAGQYFGEKIFKIFAKPATKTALTGFAKQARNFFKTAITTTGKAALPLAADMGIAGAMEIVRQEGLSDEGLINPNRNKEIEDNVKAEGLVGFVFAIAGKAVKVPKYLQSYATSVLSTMEPDDIVDYATELELTGQALPGFANTIRDEVKKYNEAKKSAGDNVNTEVEATIVGLIMKKKGLQDKLKDADDTIKPQIQTEINEINERIITTIDTKVPQEVDDKTQSKIEQDATKESEQVSTVQEGGATKPTGIIFGQQEVGQGEGSQRQATEQGTNIGDSNIGSQAQVTEGQPTGKGKTKKAGDPIRALKIKQAADTLNVNIFGIPVAMYNTALDIAANAADLGADVVEAVRAYLAEQNPEDIATIQEDALIESIKSEAEKIKSKQKTGQENAPQEVSVEVPNVSVRESLDADSKERIKAQTEKSRTVNQTAMRLILKAIDDNQVNVIKELRKTGQFSDLLVSALEAIRHTSTDSNQRISDFDKNVYNGLSEKANIEVDGKMYSEKDLLNRLIKAKRLIEIQRMLGDKFARFQSLDAEYNAALDAYASIDEATAKNKKKFDKVADKIKILNRQIVEANLDENNEDGFEKLVEAVRVEHDKADKILSEMESISEQNKEAIAKIRNARNNRQQALEYIAKRGVLIRNEDGSYALGKYKIGTTTDGKPYTIDNANAILNALSGIEKFSDLDARSENAFAAFKSILDEQYEAGLVPQDLYNDLSKYKYVPIQYIQGLLVDENSAFMKKNTAFNKARKGADLKALTGGSDGAIVTDYSTLFNVYVTTALKSIAANKALQLLDKSIKSDLPQTKATNIFNQGIAVKEAETEKNTDGTDKTDKFGNKVYKKLDPKKYVNIEVRYKDGNTMLTVPEWFATEFYSNSEYSRGWSMASSILGINLLRKMVTIANPAFGLAQLVMLDPIQAIITAKGLSPIIPIAYAEIVAQWPSVATSILNKDALYNEAVKNGVFGDMAARSGIDKFYDNAIFTGIKDVDDKVSRLNLFEKYLFGADISKIPGIKQAIEFGESTVGGSEKMTRLIVYKKAKQYFIDKGYSKEEAGQLAASEARNTANFSRAGDIIKQANHVIPYFSAAYATKRAIVKSFKRDRARATAVISQMAFGAAAVTLWSIGQLSDDEKEKEYWGEMYKALPDYYKRNYMVIRNPFHNIGDDITDAFMRVPLPFGAKEMYATIMNSDMAEYMDESVTKLDAAKEYVLSSMDIVGLGDVSSPPALSAFFKFKYNIDPFTGNKVVYDESTGKFDFEEEKEGTLPMIQAAAQKTRAFSAPRLQAAIESFTGKFDRNPITQITVNSLNSLYELAAGKENSIIKSIKDDPNKLIESPLSSAKSRFYITPTKYYKNLANSLLIDRMYAMVNKDMPDILVSMSSDRLKKLGISRMVEDEQTEFFVKQTNKFLSDVERDLGKKERIKYEKMILNGVPVDVKNILMLKIVDDNSLRDLLTEKNPSIKGRSAYQVLKDAEDSPNKKKLISTSLMVMEFWRDRNVVQSYLEAALNDKFGSEYKDKFKSIVRGNKAEAIDKMYRDSKEFNSDSQEVKDTKLAIIDNLKFMYSNDESTLNIKGDPIKEKLFGFDLPRK